MILDGFDLGVGVLFGTTRDEAHACAMMNSIAPFWDGNETWLVMIGVCLFAAFPVVYAVFLGAFYIPVLLLLIGLIFRGIAFEFRDRSERMRPVWDFGFSAGSTVVGFVQGAAIGGVMLRPAGARRPVRRRLVRSWLAPFPVLTGVGLVLGLFVARRRLARAEERRRVARLGVCAHSVAGRRRARGARRCRLLTLDYSEIAKGHWSDRRWGLVFPAIGVLALIGVAVGTRRRRDVLPFAMTVLFVVASFATLAVMFWPYMIPYSITIASAAAPEASLRFLFYGAGLFVLPVIALYTIACVLAVPRQSDEGLRMTAPTAEHARLATSTYREPGEWKSDRPVRERARVGHRARGLQRRRQRVELLSVRTRALARVSLERRRPCRHLRSGAAHVFRAGVLERPRSVSEGTHLRSRPAPKVITAKTPRSTGGTSMPRRPHRGCNGAITIRRPNFRTRGLREENARRDAHAARVRAGTHRRVRRDVTGRSSVDYAKAAPSDVCVRIRIRNAGPEAAELHVLPTLWFRNRWAWEPDAARPSIRAVDSGAACARCRGGTRRPLAAGSGRGSARRTGAAVLRERHQLCAAVRRAARKRRIRRTASTITSLHGAPTVNPARRGTKMACWYRVTSRAQRDRRAAVAADAHRCATPRCDLAPASSARSPTARAKPTNTTRRMRLRDTTDEEAAVMRQAFAGMVWSQQFYHYDVARWLDGDPAQPAPPAARKTGRNADWRHLNNHDVIAMPDKWEYPWYAAWDLAFHCVVLANTDPAAAKHQLLLMCREWYMHPNGQLPAYEWKFGDVNPPVHAWAALAVFRIDGGTDFEFLARAFHKLLINFTWWVNRKDALRRQHLRRRLSRARQHRPVRPLGDAARRRRAGAVRRHRVDGQVLPEHARDGAAAGEPRSRVRRRRAEVLRALRRRSPTAMGELWDEEDGFFYDRLRMPDGSTRPVRARSMVGLLPMFAAVRLERALWENLPDFRARAAWFLGTVAHLAHLDEFSDRRAHRTGDAGRHVAAAARARADARRERVLLAVRTAFAVALSSRASADCAAGRTARRASTTSRPNRSAASSAATRTGADRSGFR